VIIDHAPDLCDTVSRDIHGSGPVPHTFIGEQVRDPLSVTSLSWAQPNLAHRSLQHRSEFGHPGRAGVDPVLNLLAAILHGLLLYQWYNISIIGLYYIEGESNVKRANRNSAVL
jgi:hypothetical protein